ncbi:hypothetical protein CEY16_09950 [Halalkalibacillus sediminis]|uniref:Uncharacterized protein n=1 Tax=Halalkalibacillus sediminis TaxID=2018042 RepID=A0A2I0QRW3_9BACI|nr:hypothetical protein [Halalkalibacillus sediminis]PKR77061.1 hypothetical protein CEY16_09950 [Halalkalibacillus sediminis]
MKLQSRNITFDPAIGEVVKSIVDEIYQENPQLHDRFGQRGIEKCTEDNFYHMRYLHTSYQLNNPSIFEDYTHWLNSVLTNRGVPTEYIIQNFDLMIRVFERQDEGLTWSFYIELLEKGIDDLQKEILDK